MTGVGGAVLTSIRGAHSPGPTAATAAAASQRHNRPEPRPRPTARPASPLSVDRRGGVTPLPPGKCSPRPAHSALTRRTPELHFPKDKASVGPAALRHAPGCRQSRGVLRSVPSPRLVAWGRGRKVDGRGGGVADATAPTILEPASRKGLSPTHSLAGLRSRKV